jgi:excisionase family DNA binding protein
MSEHPDLTALLADLAELPTEAIPAALGALEATRATLWGRLARETAVLSPVDPPENGQAGDRLLTIAEVAARTRLSRDWLYRHKGKLPFTRRVGTRTIRFSEAALTRWLASRPR